MDVVLGVAVTGPVARLALVGSGAQGSNVLDQSVVDLAENPVETLTQTVAGTSRLLADENHRLVATRLCWPDAGQADQLRRALEDSGVHNVAVLSESQAVTALMRAAGRAGGVLVVDDETATLSFVEPHGDPDQPPTMLARQPLAGASGPDATAALDTMMARLTDQPGAPTELYLVGASSNLAGVADQLRDASTMRVEVPEDPTFALARGAALAALPSAGAAAGDATAMAPAAGFTGDETAFAPAAAAAAEEQQLAYSMAGEGEPLGADAFGPEYDDFGEFGDAEDEGATGRMPLSRRSLVLGNAVIAFAVIAFATLAAAVAIAIRPTASTQPVIGHQNAAPGKFMPLLPTQQQAPVPPPPLEAPNAGFQGGVIPDSNGYIPPQLVSPGAPAPAPEVPALVPNPNPAVPIPVPVIVPYPGWQPPYNPYPTYTPPTSTPPTTTLGPSTTPPTTTTTQPTTTQPTTTEPTTTQPTTTQPTTTEPTTTQPHVTTTQPTTQAPVTTQAPTTQAPLTTPAPHTQTQTIPTQPHTQQPVTPQQTVAPQQPVKPLLPHTTH